MKITIFVHEKYLENLYKFLQDGQERQIEWYHDRPNKWAGVFYMVTLDYEDYIKMDDLSE